MQSHEHFDNFRVIPRLMILLYGVLLYNVSDWFMSLEDPSSPQAAFVSTVVGAAGAFFGLYVNSGKSK